MIRVVISLNYKLVALVLVITLGFLLPQSIVSADNTTLPFAGTEKVILAPYNGIILSLNDSINKAGLNYYHGSGDMPKLLGGNLVNGTYVYNNIMIDSTPRNSASYILEYNSPGANPLNPPAYNFGRLPIAPNPTDYFYRTIITFGSGGLDKDMKGQTLKLFGKKYLIDSRSSDNFSGQSTEKLYLVGDKQILLQHGSKAKVGQYEDTVDGTYVNFTIANGKIQIITIYTGGRSSNEDYLAEGGYFLDPLWGTFYLYFLRIDNTSGTPSANIYLVGNAGSSLNNTLNIITSSILPSGQVDTSYTTSIQASGGTGDYWWSVSSGSLPPGLSFNHGFDCFHYPCPREAGISGNPTTAGAYKFTVTVNDGSSSISKTFSLTVNSAQTATPTLEASPYSGTAPLEVSFRASQLNAYYLYAIDFGDGSPNQSLTLNPPPCAYGVNCSNSYSANTQHTYQSAGTYKAKLFQNGLPLCYGCQPPILATAVIQVNRSGNLSISIIYPTYGPVGTQVTIVGTNFTSTNNTVNFGSGVIPNLDSTPEVCTRSLPGGCTRTITFTVPAYFTPACAYSIQCPYAGIQVTPGVYNVSVTNANGVSNSAIFKVTTVTVLSPNGGETWITGTTQTIRWQDNGGTACPVGQTCGSPTYDITLLPYHPPCTGNVCAEYGDELTLTIAKGVVGPSYNWSVGKVSNYYGNAIANDGAYTIQVCQAGTDICDSSDSYFKIVSNVASSITVLSPNGGETWKTGTTQTIKWQDIFRSHLSHDIILDPYYPPCTGGCPGHYQEPYTIAKNVTGYSYDWTVGRVMLNPSAIYGGGGTAPEGLFTIRVCSSGTDICDSSDSYFKITSETTTTPTISSLSPTSGPVGTTVTISGSGFSTNDGNVIYFQNQTASMVHTVAYSSDGQTLTFTVPSQLIYKCHVGTCAITHTPAGSYNVSVYNANGISNSVLFKVTDGGTSNIQLVKLGEKFWLSQGGAAQVTDYQNMTVKLVAVALAKCQIGSTCSTVYYVEVSLPYECSDIYNAGACPQPPGPINLYFTSLNSPQEVFGTTITMLDARNDGATFVVGKRPSSVRNVRLGEKFKLKQDDYVQVTDYKNMGIRLTGVYLGDCTGIPNDPTSCTGSYFKLEVSPPACNGDDAGACLPVANQYLVFYRLNEPQSVFGTTITMLHKTTDVATFVVGDTAYNSPVCGNGICEAGEANTGGGSYCEPDPTNPGGQICHAADGIPGTCPQDCSNSVRVCPSNCQCEYSNGEIVASTCKKPCTGNECIKQEDKKIDNTDLLNTVFTLENLKRKLDELQKNALALEKYYTDNGDTTNTDKFSRVAHVFETMKNKIDAMELKLRENMDNPGNVLEDVRAFTKDLKSDIREILKIMLGG